MYVQCVAADQCVSSSVPPVLSAHCEYWASGYSVVVVWNKPEGVWTAVEVNVTGNTHRVDKSGQQNLTIAGFQPAKTYEVSLASLSGSLRSSEPYVFKCSTDPRGEWTKLRHQSECCVKIMSLFQHF